MPMYMWQLKLMGKEKKMSERDKLKARLEQNELDVIKLAEEGSRISSELKALEMIYSRGDRFNHDGEKWIMAVTGTTRVTLLCLSDGCMHHLNITVNSTLAITETEFKVICDGGVFTRYWDNRKQVHII